MICVFFSVFVCVFFFADADAELFANGPFDDVLYLRKIYGWRTELGEKISVSVSVSLLTPPNDRGAH
jgi:hypothetical protein